MQSFLFWLALVTFIAVALIAVELIGGGMRIRPLGRVPAKLPPDPPRVSIVIAARNEERNIEEALHSVLDLDYPDLEIIVVNDRSTDRTQEILERVAAHRPGFRVLTVESLPAGWLGKNHALHFGATHATGDYLLFTDADIVMHPTVLRRAVHAMRAARLDHLTIGPHVTVDDQPLRAMIGVFLIYFMLFSRPWRASNPRSRFFIGIGAFNMLRADFYRSIGGFESIRMRPDDDIKLGKLVKKHHGRQELLAGSRLLSVEWYRHIGELIDGLMKNTFAGIEYNLPYAILATAAQFIFFVFPFIAYWFAAGAAFWLFASACAILFFVNAVHNRSQGIPILYALGFPFGTLLMGYIILRSAYLTLRNDGITWRDTHYSLRELKANKI